MSRMMSAAKMIVLLAFVCGTFLSTPLPTLHAEIPTYAESAALIDLQSGRILWSHQPKL